MSNDLKQLYNDLNWLRYQEYSLEKLHLIELVTSILDSLENDIVMDMMNKINSYEKPLRKIDCSAGLKAMFCEE